MQTHLSDEGPVGKVTEGGRGSTPSGAEFKGSSWDKETGELQWLVFTSASGLPVIQNAHTGEVWTTTWRRMIALAVAEGAGIDEAGVVSTSSKD